MAQESRSRRVPHPVAWTHVWATRPVAARTPHGPRVKATLRCAGTRPQQLVLHRQLPNVPPSRIQLRSQRLTGLLLQTEVRPRIRPKPRPTKPGAPRRVHADSTSELAHLRLYGLPRRQRQAGLSHHPGHRPCPRRCPATGPAGRHPQEPPGDGRSPLYHAPRNTHGVSAAASATTVPSASSSSSAVQITSSGTLATAWSRSSARPAAERPARLTGMPPPLLRRRLPWLHGSNRTTRRGRILHRPPETRPGRVHRGGRRRVPSIHHVTRPLALARLLHPPGRKSTWGTRPS